MKTIIVTGASGNLGQAVVKNFIAKGDKVIGTVVPNDPVSFDHAAELFEKIAVDLTDEKASSDLVTAVIDKYGSIDTAVLTVGGFAIGKIEDTSSAAILRQYQLNFETAYHIARPVFLHMLKQNSGRIFIIGSRPGLNAENGNGMLAYGLAKSLLVRLAELMNIEAKGKNVAVSVVVPSTIDTEQNRSAIPGADFSKWVQPEDIANIIYYHSSGEASALRNTLIEVYNKA